MEEPDLDGETKIASIKLAAYMKGRTLKQNQSVIFCIDHTIHLMIKRVTHKSWNWFFVFRLSLVFSRLKFLLGHVLQSFPSSRPQPCFYS